MDFYHMCRNDCVGIAFKYVYWLSREMDDEFFKDIIPLMVDVAVLRSFVLLYGIQDSDDEEEDGGNNNSDVIMRIIEDVVSLIPDDLRPDGALINAIRYREDIKFFATVIKQRCFSLFDKHYCLLGHPQRLLDFFPSLSDCMFSVFFLGLRPEEDFGYNTLLMPIKFIESLICFATRQAVDRMLVMDLLIHVDVAAAAHSALCLIYTVWFDGDRSDGEGGKNKQHEETCQLQKKIKPLFADPQLRQAYIRILTASKISKPSTHIFRHLQDQDWFEVVNKFISSLHDDLFNLQRFYINFTLSVNDQMQKLYQGVRFLTILFEERKKFTALDDELKDLIGALIIDAGILFCSLSFDDLKQGLAKESDLAISHWVRALEFIMSEIDQIHPPTFSSSSSSSSSFPKTNELGSFDFLLQNLKELSNTEADSIAFMKAQFHTIQDDLEFLRSFLEKITEQRYHNSELQTLWDSIMEAAYKTEFAIDMILFDKHCPFMLLSTIIKEINSLKVEVNHKAEVLHNLRNVHSPGQKVTETSIHMTTRVSARAPKLVGHNKELSTIINRLTRGSNRLGIISIVGMAGVGKTTLATEVYHHPSIKLHFHFQSWCTVSQIYSKRNLLLQIMIDDKYLNMDENDLAHKLHKHLRGKKYLIILDDVWSVEAFNLLRESFPNDENGSRLLITSRHRNLCSEFEEHELPLLKDDESWELLKIKLSGVGCCPPELGIHGKQIALHCKGLPLTIVVVAGVLANSDPKCWEDVAKRLSTFIEIQEQCRETLELSYKNLPNYLKPCLLYFGAFREDQDISVQSLLRLWISEGFVRHKEKKSLEEVANEYLMNLIGRSLVMVTKQRSVDGAKICRVHDLLYEFCVRKAQEENFLQILGGGNKVFASTTLYNPHRLSIHNWGETAQKRRILFPHLRSLLWVSGECLLDFSFLLIFQEIKLLRVLDIACEYPSSYISLKGIQLLLHLRYLAIPYPRQSIPSEIANLTRLETFSIYSKFRYREAAVKLPNTIWYMKKLRHLCYRCGFIFPIDNLEVAPDLYNLQSCNLHIDCSSESLLQIMKKLPSIRTLKCVYPQYAGHLENFHCLNQLESLRIEGRFLRNFVSGTHLKKLTLIRSYNVWSEISAIGKLPNLEVLKLLSNSWGTWEVREEEFPKLKFLKLEGLYINNWTLDSSADEVFPRLEKLVLHGCTWVEGDRCCLGYIPNIKMIEMIDCNQSATDFVKQIQQEQRQLGNDDLEVTISLSMMMADQVDCSCRLEGASSHELRRPMPSYPFNFVDLV